MPSLTKRPLPALLPSPCWCCLRCSGNILLSVAGGSDASFSSSSACLSAKLCDAGLAERLLHPASVLELDGYGVAAWKAPETLFRGHASRAADVYGLAATAFSLWAADGRAPWAGCGGSGTHGLPTSAELFPRLYASRGGPRAHVLSCFSDAEWAGVPPPLQSLLRRCAAYDWGESDDGGSGGGADEGGQMQQKEAEGAGGGVSRPSCGDIVAELEGMLATLAV